jgi:hypothetical protein
MDSARFDSLTQMLGTFGTRRGALAVVFGGAISLFATAETEAGKNKKKRKTRKRKKNRLTCVADGIKNGSETGIDCGGGCVRCAADQTCATRNDCASALCNSGTCQQCSQAPNNCGVESDGSACNCFVHDGNSICFKATAPIIATSCEECPANTLCFSPGGGEFLCYTLCGAP